MVFYYDIIIIILLLLLSLFYFMTLNFVNPLTCAVILTMVINEINIVQTNISLVS